MRLRSSLAAACCLAVLALTGPAFSQALPASTGTETILYDRAPVRIGLPTDQERILVFPEAVQLGFSPELARKVRAQAVEDTIYLKANEDFPVTDESRVAAIGLETGAVYMLDFAAGADEDRTMLSIVPVATQTTAAIDEARDPETRQADPVHGLVALTRFAARQIYAPPRLVSPLEGVTRVPVRVNGPTSSLVLGGSLLLEPIASWRAQEGLTVTAVRAINRLPHPVEWDPRLLRGSWTAATAHHSVLGPAGTAADTTALYLVSDRSFKEAAGPWLN